MLTNRALHLEVILKFFNAFKPLYIEMKELMGVNSACSYMIGRSLVFFLSLHPVEVRNMLSSACNPKCARVWNRALITGSLSPHPSDDEFEGAVPVSCDQYGGGEAPVPSHGAAPVPFHGGCSDDSGQASLPAIFPGGNVASPCSGNEAAAHVHGDRGSSREQSTVISDCVAAPRDDIPVAAPRDDIPVAAPPHIPVAAPRDDIPVAAPRDIPVAAPRDIPVAAPRDDIPVAAPRDIPVAAPPHIPVAALRDTPVAAPPHIPVAAPRDGRSEDTSAAGIASSPAEYLVLIQFLRETSLLLVGYAIVWFSKFLGVKMSDSD